VGEELCAGALLVLGDEHGRGFCRCFVALGEREAVLGFVHGVCKLEKPFIVDHLCDTAFNNLNGGIDY